jgi:hypothetical protein
MPIRARRARPHGVFELSLRTLDCSIICGWYAVVVIVMFAQLLLGVGPGPWLKLTAPVGRCNHWHSKTSDPLAEEGSKAGRLLHVP